jgi:hypothetical protein
MNIEVCDQCETQEDVLHKCTSCKGDEVYCQDCFEEHVEEQHAEELASDHWQEFSDKK